MRLGLVPDCAVLYTLPRIVGVQRAKELAFSARELSAQQAHELAALALGPGEHTVTFTVPASVLGKPASLSGVQLFVNTWDYDGGYRGLTATPGGYTLGGGDGRVDPLWMDDSGVITLP